jgi:hypothetical protein
VEKGGGERTGGDAEGERARETAGERYESADVLAEEEGSVGLAADAVGRPSEDNDGDDGDGNDDDDDDDDSDDDDNDDDDDDDADTSAAGRVEEALSGLRTGDGSAVEGRGGVAG